LSVFKADYSNEQAGLRSMTLNEGAGVGGDQYPGCPRKYQFLDFFFQNIWFRADLQPSVGCAGGLLRRAWSGFISYLNII
jgi:hypothetical protein